MTTSKAEFTSWCVQPRRPALVVLTMILFGVSPCAIAQELNGNLVLEQTHAGAQLAINNITVDDFRNTNISETTLATGNSASADLVEGGAHVTQSQTGSATAQSWLSVGDGAYLRGTAVAAGNATTLSGNANTDEFTAKIWQLNSGPVSANTLLDAGSIAFYAAIFDTSGNDANLKSDQFRSQFLLTQSNSGANDASVRQTGNVSSASTQTVVAGNKTNFVSNKQLPAREPAYRQ